MITSSLLFLVPFLPSLPLDPVAGTAPRILQAKGEAPAISSFRYDYGEAGLAIGDLDGLRLGGSMALEGPWIALGRLEYLTDDEGNSEVDLLLLSGGVGYVHPVEPNLDFVGSVEVEVGSAEIDTPGGSADDDDVGLNLRGGVRFQATEELELAGGLSVRTIFDEDLGLDLAALYAFNENVSGFLGFDSREDSFVVIGVRYYF